LKQEEDIKKSKNKELKKNCYKPEKSEKEVVEESKRKRVKKKKNEQEVVVEEVEIDRKR